MSVYDNDTGEMCPGCVLEATDDQITVRCDDGVDGYYSPGYLTWDQDAWTDLSHHRSVGR